MDTMSTYEKSVWKDPSPMADDEEEMEKIWKQCYSLTEFIDPENTDMYKTLAKQKADLARYLGEDEEEDDDNVKPAKEEKSKSFAKELDDDIPFKEPKSSKDDEEEEDDLPFTVDDSDEDDDDDSFFDKFKE
jgi:threonyl-tRNA synthetase